MLHCPCPCRPVSLSPRLCRCHTCGNAHVHLPSPTRTCHALRSHAHATIPTLYFTIIFPATDYYYKHLSCYYYVLTPLLVPVKSPPPRMRVRTQVKDLTSDRYARERALQDALAQAQEERDEEREGAREERARAEGLQHSLAAAQVLASSPCHYCY